MMHHSVGEMTSQSSSSGHTGVRRRNRAHLSPSATVPHPNTFPAFVFPRPNYLVTRSATISLDESHLVVTDRSGAELFRSPLSDLRLGSPADVYAPAGMPYNLFWGPDDSLVRIGFSRTGTRTALLVLALVVTIAVLSIIEVPNIVFGLSLAALIMLPLIWAARRSTVSVDGDAFYERLLELEPTLADREIVPLPSATTGFGRFWLLAGVGLAILVVTAFLVMLGYTALRPDVVPSSPDETPVRLMITAAVFAVLSAYVFRVVRPHRPWATARFGGPPSFVRVVMPPLLAALVLGAIAVARQVTGM